MGQVCITSIILKNQSQVSFFRGPIWEAKVDRGAMTVWKFSVSGGSSLLQWVAWKIQISSTGGPQSRVIPGTSVSSLRWSCTPGILLCAFSLNKPCPYPLLKQFYPRRQPAVSSASRPAQERGNSQSISNDPLFAGHPDLLNKLV